MRPAHNTPTIPRNEETAPAFSTLCRIHSSIKHEKGHTMKSAVLLSVRPLCHWNMLSTSYIALIPPLAAFCCFRGTFIPQYQNMAYIDHAGAVTDSFAMRHGSRKEAAAYPERMRICRHSFLASIRILIGVSSYIPRPRASAKSECI